MRQTYRIVKIEVAELGLSYYIGEIRRRNPYTMKLMFIPIEKTKAHTYEDCLTLVKNHHEEKKKEIENGVSKEFTLY